MLIRVDYRRKCTVNSFTFTSRFPYELKRKVGMPKSLCANSYFQFRFISVKVSVQKGTWHL